MDKQVVITGAMGFVGSHTAKVFQSAGYQVIGIDWEPTIPQATRYLHTWIKDDFVNVIDTAAKKDIPIIHCAGTSLVGPSMVYPGMYYHNNSAKTNTALEKLLVNGWSGTFVFSSSAATYGIPENSSNILETSSQRPISPYGWSKLFCEQIIHDHSASRKQMRGIALRYFNACGCDPDTTLGHTVNDTHLIPRILSAHQNGRPFTLYGNDYATPDGTCIRDYLHVMDIAQAHLAAVEYSAQLPQGTFEAYNLGTGYGLSNRVVLEACGEIVGMPIDYTIVERRPGDPDALIANADRFKQATGWYAQNSDIGTIVKTTWEWQKNLPLLVD